MKTDTPQKYMDAFLQTEPYYTICYRSGLTVYEESLIMGRFVASGWNGAGYPLSVSNLPEPLRLKPEKFAMPQAFQVEIDGQMLGSHWDWAGFEKEQISKGLHVKISLKHQVRPVTVAVHTLLDGTPIITRWLEITNEGENVAALSELVTMSGAMQSTRKWKNHLRENSPLYTLGYMEDTHWGDEGNFQWHNLPNAGYRVCGRFRRERHRHPMFVLKNEATGEHFICQFAWSGGYAFEFDLDADPGTADQNAHLSYKVEMDAPAPLRTVTSHETVKSPEIHMGMLFGGLDDAIQAMHTHLRESVLMPQARGRGCWVEGAIGPEMEMTEEMTLRLIDDATYFGTEVFFIDAGWYVPPKCEGSEWWLRAGDWQVNRERYKNGLGPIRDKVKKNGMLFGLWMDAERIGSMSEIVKKHPEFIVGTYSGKKSNCGMLDLTNPDVAKWMENEIARVIEENELDFFRLDYNVAGWDAVFCSIRDGFVENGYWRYYEAVYGIYDKLRTRFPNVIFENCAGGGGRTDVGMVSRFCHTWVTDWQIAPRSFSITNGMTMALPPEYVDRLIAGQGGWTTASLSFQARLLLFVRPTIGSFYPHGSEMNRVQMEFVRHTVDIYKNFIRPFMPESRIYHHTPVFDGIEPKGWGILELTSCDSAKGIVGIFQLSNPVEQETMLHLRGVDVSKRYRVTWDNSGRSAVVDGYTLTNDGIHIRQEGALISELLLYEAES
ncbi:MAG: alpha-galactosidase [Clostridiales bacterium]|nr:alpha-galactosidase [Clostridiales bacterium]